MTAVAVAQQRGERLRRPRPWSPDYPRRLALLVSLQRNACRRYRRERTLPLDACRARLTRSGRHAFALPVTASVRPRAMHVASDASPRSTVNDSDCGDLIQADRFSTPRSGRRTTSLNAHLGRTSIPAKFKRRVRRAFVLAEVEGARPPPPAEERERPGELPASELPREHGDRTRARARRRPRKNRGHS